MSDELIEIGYVIRTHGVKGHLRIAFNENIKELSAQEALYFLVKGVMLPFFIEETETLKDGTVIIKLEEFHSMEEASLYTKRPVYGPSSYAVEVEEEVLPDYQNYLVIDEQMGELGKVGGVIDMGEYDLVEINYRGREIMIPLHDESVIAIDDEEHVIHVKLPEGMLDI